MKKLITYACVMMAFLITLQAQSPSQQIVAIQYFWDQDPGFDLPGNGAIVPVTPAASVTQTLDIDIPTSLTNGFHTLCVRAKDKEGRWSIAERKSMYILVPQATQPITAMEYFIDDDPGQGNGIPVPVSAGDAINKNFAIPLSQLSAGFHRLCVRTKNAAGIWSVVERKSMYIIDPQPTQPIVAMEYFIDNDPGEGSGTPVSVSGGDAINPDFAVILPSLSAGFHRLFVRTRDAAGNWSIVERGSFYVVPPNAENITAYQYVFDNDQGPGIAGNGAIVSVTPVSPFHQAVPIAVPGTLSDDHHLLLVRTQNEFGSWSIAERRAIAVGTCTTVETGGIESWWSFDWGDEDDLPDFIGDHDGIGVNGISTIGYAFFDGINDYIGVPDDTAWAFGSKDFTIEFQANFADPGGGADPFYKFIGQSEGTGNSKKWTFVLASGQLYFRLDDGTTSQNLAQFPFSPTYNQWYHLALTRKGDTLRTYINGQPSVNQVVSNLFIPDVDAPLQIGWVDWALTVGGGGYMSGSLDEMTIFNYALSGQEIQDIANAGAAGKCKDFKITTPAISDAKLGHLFTQTLEAVYGEHPLNWSVAGGELPRGIAIDSSGRLSGRPTEAGAFTFTAQVTDANNANAQKEFTFEVWPTLPEPEIALFKAGTAAVPGREMDYFILAENNGSVDIDTVHVEAYLQHWFHLIDAFPAYSVDVEIPNYFTLDTTDMQPLVFSWHIPLSSGESSVLHYKVLLHPSVPIGQIVRGGWDCEYGTKKVCRADSESTCKEPQFGNCLRGNTDYAPRSAGGSGTFENGIERCLHLYCTRTSERYCTCEEKPTQAPVDPNEKLVLAPYYIKPDALLPYVIHFENIGTIEAQDIFISDTLDENLDETTLNIISPGATFDTATRILRWELYDINLEPDSSGYVLYTIRPKPNLPSCTVIENKAYIQFEVFDVFATNITVNVIDVSVPEGVMDTLPDTMYQTAFPISWGGADTCGEIRSYSIFVAVDSGAYTEYLTTSDTSAIFTGETGKTYHFLCIAKDVAGNVEVQEPLAETSTTLEVACTDVYYYDADNDGYGNSSFPSTSCSQPTGFVSDSTDCDDADASIHPAADEICGNFIDENCNGMDDDECCDISVDAGDDVTTFFGIASMQQVDRTAVVSGGTAPVSFSWTLGRPLLCNQENEDGDEDFYGGSCTNNICPQSGSATDTASCSGSATITAVLLDTTTICVTVTDANGCTATDCFTVNASDARCFGGNGQNNKVIICHHTNNPNNPWVEICVDTSALAAHLAHGDYVGPCSMNRLGEFKEEPSLNLRLFPNPARELVNMTFNSLDEKSYVVDILDVTGRKVASFYGKANAGENTRELSVADLEEGIYLVKLVLDSVQEVKKLALE